MSASVAAKLSYLTDTEKFKTMLPKLDVIGSDLSDIESTLENIGSKDPPDPIQDIIEEFNDSIKEAREQISDIRKAPDMGSVRTLVMGFGAAGPAIIEKIINGSEDDDTRGLKTLDDPLKQANLDEL